jgi:hypothetical protein
MTPQIILIAFNGTRENTMTTSQHFSSSLSLAFFLIGQEERTPTEDFIKTLKQQS